MAGGACGWLRVGRAFGVLLLPGLGSAALAPRFLGTQPPCATQALTHTKDNNILNIAYRDLTVFSALFSQRSAHSNAALDDSFISVHTTSLIAP